MFETFPVTKFNTILKPVMGTTDLILNIQVE
jgi:hypothetical protein